MKENKISKLGKILRTGSIGIISIASLEIGMSLYASNKLSSSTEDSERAINCNLIGSAYAEKNYKTKSIEMFNRAKEFEKSSKQNKEEGESTWNFLCKYGPFTKLVH